MDLYVDLLYIARITQQFKERAMRMTANHIGSTHTLVRDVELTLVFSKTDYDVLIYTAFSNRFIISPIT